MRKLTSLVLFVLAVAFLAGCSGGVSDKDKANSATKFKSLNKNDVNHDASG